MKLFLRRKSTGNSKVIEVENKEYVWANLSQNGKDLSDYEVLTPQEYQENEINRSRKEVVEQEHPELAKQFPRTAENPTLRSGVNDALTLPGRGLSAAIDGIANRSLEESQKSLGEAEATDRDRSTIGRMGHGMLRDKMLLPSLMLGEGLPFLAAKAATKFPILGRLGTTIEKPAQTMLGRFAKADLLKPGMTGAATGLGVGLARHPVTGDEMQLGEDVLTNALGGAVLHNVAGAANLGLKTAASKLKNSNSVREANAMKDLSRWGESKPSEILGDIEKDYGVNLENWDPSMQTKIPQSKSFWEAKANQMLGWRPRTLNEADFLGNNTGTGRNALIAGTSRSGIKGIEGAYRTQREIADGIIEKLDVENLIGKDFEPWQNYLNEVPKPRGTSHNANALSKGVPSEAPLIVDSYGGVGLAPDQYSGGALVPWQGSTEFMPGRAIDTKPILQVLRHPIKEHGDHFKKLAEYIKDIEQKPYMTPKELNSLRRLIDSDIKFNRTSSNKGMIDIEESALKAAAATARDLNLRNAELYGRKDAVDAYKRNAEALKLRDDVLHRLKADKGDARDVEMKMANIFKNRGDESSNSIINQGVFEALERLDSHLGTNYAKQVENAYMANQLSPHGKEFSLPDYNKHFTGKNPQRSLLEATKANATAKAAFIKTARNKAMDLKAAMGPSQILGDVEVPKFAWGNAYGGGKERDKQIREMK